MDFSVRARWLPLHRFNNCVWFLGLSFHVGGLETLFEGIHKSFRFANSHHHAVSLYCIGALQNPDAIFLQRGGVEWNAAVMVVKCGGGILSAVSLNEFNKLVSIEQVSRK